MEDGHGTFLFFTTYGVGAYMTMIALRQGLQKMNYYGYSAIPVLDEEERCVGTITEGDFL